MGGMIACLAAIKNQENLSGLILESAAIEMHPKTASWTARTAAKILSKEGLHKLALILIKPYKTNGSWNQLKRFSLHLRLVVIYIVIFPGKLK